MNRIVYNYKAEILGFASPHVVDLNVTLGFRLNVEKRMFLYGINYPELDTRNPTMLRGAAANAFTAKACTFAATLFKGKRVVIAPKRPNREGRVSTRIYIPCDSESPDHPQLTQVFANQRFLLINQFLLLAADKFDIEAGKTLAEQLGVKDVT